MINIIDDMLNKYSDSEILEYLEKHARELAKGYRVVIDAKADPSQLLVLYGKVEMMSDVLTKLKKRDELRRLQSNMV